MKTRLLKSNIITLLLCLVVVTMPLKSSVNSMSIIFLLCYSLFHIFLNRKQINFKTPTAVYLLIIPFMFILIQGFYSEWSSFTKNAIRSLPLILFPLIFYYLKSWIKSSQYKTVLRSLVLSAICYSLYLLIIAFYRQIQYSPDFSDVNWYFFTYYDFTDALLIHPTYMGMYCSLAFAIILSEILLNNQRVFLKILSALFLGVIIFLLGSRIALTCLILIIFSFLLFKFKSFNLKKLIILFTILIVTPLLVFKFVPIVKERMIDMTFGLKQSYQYARYGNKGNNNNYTGGLTPRFQIWSCAIEITNENFFFGNGFGYTQHQLNECYESKGLFDFSKEDYQTHNQYLNNYARGGVIGFLVLLLLYIYPLFFSIRGKQIVFMSFIIIIMVTSLTENILNRQLGIVFFSFFNSLFFFSANKGISKWK